TPRSRARAARTTRSGRSVPHSRSRRTAQATAGALAGQPPTALAVRRPLNEDAADLEQPFHFVDLPPVGDEQDHVVVGLYFRVVMRHQHVVAAHDRADRGAARQLNLLDEPAYHAGLPRLAVRDG